MNEVEIIVTSKDHSRHGFDSADRRARGFGDTMRRIGEGVSKLFTKGVEGAVESGADMFQAFFKSTSTAAMSMATSVGTAIAGSVTAGGGMTVATGGINLLVGALLAAASAAAMAATGFLALAPIVLIAGGAFGAAMTAAVGLVGTIAVLKMGFSGIGDAMTEFNKDGKISEETLKKLSPNAREFVKALTELKKPFDDLRKFVQDKLLDGMNEQIKGLAKVWLPALKPILGDLASRFNAFAANVTDALGKPDFIKNIKTAMAGFGDFIDRIGESMPGLIDAFGRLAKASVPFLKELGDMIGGLIEKFSEWIKQADETGALEDFMKNAAQALRDIWDIGGLVIGIGKEIIEIFFPSSDRAADSFLGGVKKFLQEIKDWLADPENKQKIQDWIDKLFDFMKTVKDEWLPRIKEWAIKIDGWVKKLEEWGEKISNFVDDVKEKWKILSTATKLAWDLTGGAVINNAKKLRDAASAAADWVRSKVSGAWDSVSSKTKSAWNSASGAVSSAGTSIKNTAKGAVDWVIARFNTLVSNLRGIPGRVGGAFSGMFDGVKSAFKSAMNWVIARWNNFSIPGINTPFGTIGGFNTPNLNYFAQGGIGGGLAMVGERGRELVRLPQGSTVIPNGTTEAMLANGTPGEGPTINLYVQGSIRSDRDLIAMIRDEFINGGFRGVVTA